MTIIGAVNCGEYMAVAADSMAFTGPSGIKSDITKLWAIRGLAVVWGYMGAGTIGGDLRAWIDANDLSTSKDWLALKSTVADQMARLTGEFRGRAATAGADVRPAQLTWALFAGFVGGEPQIVTVTPDGEAAIAPTPVIFLATDTGQSSALASLATLRLERGERFALSIEGLRISMAVATELTFTAGGAIQMWKVTATGPERIT